MTIANNLKEIMSNMPDNLNTKKEIDAYYKTAIAKAIQNNKKDNDAKPKKELNEYQRFMKDNMADVKLKNPQLTGPQIFAMIASMWKKHKSSGSVDAEEADVAEATDKAVVTDTAVAAVAAVAPEESNDKDEKADVKADVKADKKKPVKQPK